MTSRGGVAGASIRLDAEVHLLVRGGVLRPESAGQHHGEAQDTHILDCPMGQINMLRRISTI
jgi:hypothetical protein